MKNNQTMTLQDKSPTSDNKGSPTAKFGKKEKIPAIALPNEQSRRNSGRTSDANTTDLDQSQIKSSGTKQLGLNTLK